MPLEISHVIGFDDAPFDRDHRGDVAIFGAVYSGPRLEGVLSGKVRRDGEDSTAALIQMVSRSRFAPQLQAVMVQGIAFAGFNVIDLHALHEALAVPVLAITRRQPDLARIKRALIERVADGDRKWALIERLGPMERTAGVYAQRVGISAADSERVIRKFAINGILPEPLRTAHLIAGGVMLGESRHRP